MINVYIGEDNYLTTNKLNSDLKKKYGNFETVELVKFDLYNDTLETVLNEASSYSFFYEAKVVIVSNCYFLSTSKEKVKKNKDDLAELEKFLTSSTDNLDLNFIVKGSLDKNALYKKMVEAKVNFIHVDLLSDEELIMTINSKVKNENKKISVEAVKELIARCKNPAGVVDFLLLDNNLKKLMTFTDNITIIDVEEMVYKPLEDKIFAIGQNLIKGETDKALHAYYDLVQLGNQVYGIISALYYSFLFMARVKFLANKQVSLERMQIALNVKNKYRVKYSMMDVKDVSYENLVKILADLSRLEEDCKFNGFNPFSALELFIASFSGNYLY